MKTSSGLESFMPKILLYMFFTFRQAVKHCSISKWPYCRGCKEKFNWLLMIIHVLDFLETCYEYHLGQDC